MPIDPNTPSFLDDRPPSEGQQDTRALPKGFRIDEFEIQEVIGSGSFAIVYRAFDHSLGRDRAIKEYLPRELAGRLEGKTVTLLSSRDEAAYADGLRRFVAEAKLLAGINHPAVVRVYRCIETHRTAYMVMDLCQGETLEDRIARGAPADEAWVRNFLRMLLEGVDTLHKTRILHRDIKPSNIYVVDDARPVLIDFGSARQLAGVGSKQAMTALVTYNYSAPEQWDSTGQFEQGPYTDIYSIGATVYEMVCGRRPNSSNTRLLKDSLVPAADLAAGKYSRGLLHSIDHALKVDIKERYQDASAWLADLARSGAPAAGGKKTSLLRILLPALAAAAIAAWFFLQRGGSHEAAPAVALPAAGSLIRDCAQCPEMMVLPTGEFQQGGSGNTADRDELPRHPVKLPVPFAVARYEVSRAQFRDFINASGHAVSKDPACGKADRNWQDPGFPQRDDEPVVCVSWFDAKAYADWLSRVTGKAYRLPSESEWEYAARAGDEGAAPWGDQPERSCDFANLADESYLAATGGARPAAKPAPKKGEAKGEEKAAEKRCNDQAPFTAAASTSLRANRFLVHDTLGNVAEWTADCYAPDYTGAPADGAAVDASPCSQRVFRGGAFNFQAKDVSYSKRGSFPPGERKPYVGLRVARALDGAAPAPAAGAAKAEKAEKH